MVGTPGVITRTVESLQFQVRKLAEYLQRDSFFGRRTIRNISVSTTAVQVSHALGYEPSGYIVIRKNANVTVYNGAINRDTITLQASGSAVIDILVW